MGFYSHDQNTQQCSQNVQHQVNSYAQSMSQGIKLSPSPRPSSDNRLLGIEKQQHMINSLSTTSGGYVCSASSDSTKHNSSPNHQVIVSTPSHSRMDSISRLSSIPVGDDSCHKPT